MALPPIEVASEEHVDFPDSSGGKQIAGKSPVRIALTRLRHDKVAMTSTAVVVFFVLVGAGAPLWTKLAGVTLRAANSSSDIGFDTYPLVGPPDHGFDIHHPFGVAIGTGYDLFAEWVYGARTSLEVATASVVLATVMGILIGLVAGFSTGWLDKVISFVIDVFLTLPFLLVAFMVAAILVSRFASDPNSLGTWRFWTLILILGGFGWMGLARLIRGEILSLREREFIQAARVIGVPYRSILFKELLPNLLAPIVVSISLGLPAYVAAEAAFAYLGIGLTDRPSWGQTIAQSVNYFDSYGLWLWEPLLGVLAFVMALNLLGDAVRDAFDPKTRR
ncbi:MAG: ABC transporter permease [Nocardioidaceae bacterium]